ncbi:MAG: C25 family cysteine peptidase [Polyangiales bacterium]
MTKTATWMFIAGLVTTTTGCAAQTEVDEAGSTREAITLAGGATTSPTISPTVSPYPICLLPPAFCGAPASAKLLIVAPDAFKSALAPLVTHKNGRGVSTALVSLEGAVASFSGADDAEKVKKAIVWANRNLSTQYVMLVGSARVFPVRSRAVTQPKAPAGQCPTWLDATYNPSELYYANLYKDHVAVPLGNGTTEVSSGGIYDNWDGNGDGKYDEEMWTVDAAAYNPDAVDGYPDIALGRVPADTAAMVTTYVNKVIAYETGNGTIGGNDRFTFFAHAGYSTADSLSDGIAGNLAAATSKSKLVLDAPAGYPYLPGWSAAGSDDIHLASAFSLWVSYVGHGWAGGWVGNNFDKSKAAALANPYNFPIVVGVACQTGEITGNAPVDGTYYGIDGKNHTIGTPSGCQSSTYDYSQGVSIPLPMKVVPPSNYDKSLAVGASTFAGSWLFNANGGAIAYFGETVVQPDGSGAKIQGYMQKHWQQGKRVLGDIWRSAGHDYWVANKTNGDIFDAPRIQLGIMTMYGDPTLTLPK